MEARGEMYWVYGSKGSAGAATVRRDLVLSPCQTVFQNGADQHRTHSRNTSVPTYLRKGNPHRSPWRTPQCSRLRVLKDLHLVESPCWSKFLEGTMFHAGPLLE